MFKKNNYTNEYSIDVSFYPDMQELLFVSDILISDYSSCMFDFMLLKKPCFVFAPDINNFDLKRGFYYSLNQTPFAISNTNNELRQNINKFDFKEYIEKCEKFIKKMQVVNDGNSSKRAVELIRNCINKRI